MWRTVSWHRIAGSGCLYRSSLYLASQWDILRLGSSPLPMPCHSQMLDLCIGLKALYCFFLLYSLLSCRGFVPPNYLDIYLYHHFLTKEPVKSWREHTYRKHSLGPCEKRVDTHTHTHNWAHYTKKSFWKLSSHSTKLGIFAIHTASVILLLEVSHLCHICPKVSNPSVKMILDKGTVSFTSVFSAPSKESMFINSWGSKKERAAGGDQRRKGQRTELFGFLSAHSRHKHAHPQNEGTEHPASSCFPHSH